MSFMEFAPGRHLALGVLLGALSTNLGGCGVGDGLDRKAIRGSVTLDGEPLAAGSLLLEPISEESGTAVGAAIRRGAYRIARADGPVPGTYRVRIYASSRVQAPAPVGASERTPRPMLELVPPRYNVQSELIVKVSPDGANRFEHTLSSNDDADRARPLADGSSNR